MKMLDLFSGIGGFSLAAHKTEKIETIAFCEVDKSCREVLNKNFPGVPIFEDIGYLTYTKGNDGTYKPEGLESYLYDGFGRKEWKQGINFRGGIDIICGGFPCQDVSTAGKQRGFTNEKGEVTRSGLWGEYARIIKESKPKYIVIENVRNLLNLGMARVLTDLYELGYNAEWDIISAASVGANHQRDRIFIVAYSKTSNANVSGFWPAFTSTEEKSEWWTKATSCFYSWWQNLPRICRMDDGISLGVDKNLEPEKYRRERVKQCGNAIVPFIAQIIFNRIVELENP